jgi:hypothetical protein
MAEAFLPSSSDLDSLEEDILTSGKKAIYIANIPLQITQETLVTIFSQFALL